MLFGDYAYDPTLPQRRRQSKGSISLNSIFSVFFTSGEKYHFFDFSAL
jgi:hypothetical protein